MLLSTVTLASEFILTSESLGGLQLNKETKISKAIINKYFPEHRVSHEIGEGDSADFHYFEIKDNKSELIFTVTSYIDNDFDRNKDVVTLDLIEIYSDSISDEYGLKIGKKLSDIINQRGGDLIYGANHHDNHIGLNNIWYALSTEDLNVPNGPDISPENVTLEDAKKHNLRVTAISWPSARW